MYVNEAGGGRARARARAEEKPPLGGLSAASSECSPRAVRSLDFSREAGIWALKCEVSHPLMLTANIISIELNKSTFLG